MSLHRYIPTFLVLLLSICSYGQIDFHSSSAAFINIDEFCQDEAVDTNMRVRHFYYIDPNAKVEISTQVLLNDSISIYTFDTLIQASTQYQSFQKTALPNITYYHGENEIREHFSMIINDSIEENNDVPLLYGLKKIHIGSENCREITAIPFYDANGNQHLDSGEIAFENLAVNISQLSNNEGFVHYTNSQGEVAYSLSDKYQFSHRVADRIIRHNSFYEIDREIAGLRFAAQSDTTILFPYQRFEDSETEVPFYNASTQDSACSIPKEISFGFNIKSKAPIITAVHHYGDGVVDSITYTLSGSSNQFFSVAHSYESVGIFHPRTEIVVLDTTIYLTYPPITISDDCGNTSGVVYQDVNNNCLFDLNTDIVVPGARVIISTGGLTHSTQSNKDGKYFFNYLANSPLTVYLHAADTVNGKINSHPDLQGLRACMPIFKADSFAANIDFGLKCDTALNDLRVFTSPVTLRPGFNTTVTLYPEVTGCDEHNTAVSFTLDQEEEFQWAKPTPDVIQGKNLIWNLSKLNSFNEPSIKIGLRLDSTSAIGDTIWHRSSIGNVPGEHSYDNNVYHQRLIVSGSYDPNDKTCFDLNTGELLPGAILPHQKDLFYRIRFQNTGTDTAFNIYVIDTLASEIDLRFFKLWSASHPVETTISPEGKIRFQFNDILLPDENTNEQESHGDIFYSVRLKDGLSLGTHIRNTAYIYFDYNLPIVTNTTDNNIADVTQVKALSDKTPEIQFFPNPSNGSFKIKTDITEGFSITLYNLSGRKVYEKEVKRSEIEINTALPQGIYIAVLTQQNFNYTFRLLIN